MKYNFSEKETKEILKVLKDCHGNYNQASKRLVLSERAIMTVDIIENKKFNYTGMGQGPDAMQKYLIARREVFSDQGWNHNDAKIKQARELYDEGKVEMATGRDGLVLLLYAIPRREKEIRKPYFSAPQHPDVIV